MVYVSLGWFGGDILYLNVFVKKKKKKAASNLWKGYAWVNTSTPSQKGNTLRLDNTDHTNTIYPMWRTLTPSLTPFRKQVHLHQSGYRSPLTADKYRSRRHHPPLLFQEERWMPRPVPFLTGLSKCCTQSRYNPIRRRSAYSWWENVTNKGAVGRGHFDLSFQMHSGKWDGIPLLLMFKPVCVRINVKRNDSVGSILR